MQPTKTSIADALFSKTQQRVLGLLFGQPDRAFGTLEIIAYSSSGRGTIQRELERLTSAGLITRESSRGLVSYRANHDAPIFEELRRIVEKTGGVPDVIRRALQPFVDRIRFAVIYGSIASDRATAKSDIDLLVVADKLELDELYDVLQSAERQLGRPVSPTLYSSTEFRKRRQSGQAFLTRMLAGKHVVVMGSENGIGEPR